MLDNFNWDTPESSAGAHGTPTMRVLVKHVTLEDKATAKFLFSLNKTAGRELGLEGDIPAAVSFDEAGALILALHVPKTVPSYNLRDAKSGGHQFANRRFAEKALDHFGGVEAHPPEKGTSIVNLKWEEKEKEGKIRFFKLTQKDEIVD